jgi:hypothetical protein
VKVTAIVECFFEGSRRRQGSTFEIDASEYEYDGVVKLPSCVMPAGGPANAAVREIQSRPYRAARASCGNPGSVTIPKALRDFEREPDRASVIEPPPQPYERVRRIRGKRA